MKPKFISRFAVLAILLFSTLTASAASVTVRHHHGPRHRTTVTVRTGHPIHRSMHTVVVRRPAVVVRATAAVFLPVVVWRTPLVVTVRPAPDRIVWQDAEELDREDDWSEISFNSDQRGERLYLDVVSGKVQFDFAEVVFENGDCQVVDFNETTHARGLYLLLDFKDGRKVDHVRLIARAKSKAARVALVMAK